MTDDSKPRRRGKKIGHLDEGPFKGHDVYVCDDTRIELYGRGVDMFLALIDIKAALCTDESTVGDFFCSVSSDEENRKEAAKLDAALGRTVSWGEYVWQVAKELEDLEAPKVQH